MVSCRGLLLLLLDLLDLVAVPQVRVGVAAVLLGLELGTWYLALLLGPCAGRWQTEVLLLRSPEHSCPHGTAGCCVVPETHAQYRNNYLLLLSTSIYVSKYGYRQKTKIIV